jgi:hypothetical protein
MTAYAAHKKLKNFEWCLSRNGREGNVVWMTLLDRPGAMAEYLSLADVIRRDHLESEARWVAECARKMEWYRDGLGYLKVRTIGVLPETGDATSLSTSRDATP